ncbi:hypothetical protein [Campylobacter concisus]|uniref:hypothetical protein n=1 Tax=Campylobacter concisus TaxID=199 RepID=UPI00112FA2B0|nr:hypothetical protein [Campylobacter concisus]
MAGVLAKIEFAFCTANFTSRLSNLRCFEAFYAVCIECFLTNFCWRGRYKFEAWLNFLLGWRADHYF